MDFPADSFFTDLLQICKKHQIQLNINNAEIIDCWFSDANGEHQQYVIKKLLIGPDLNKPVPTTNPYYITYNFEIKQLVMEPFFNVLNNTQL